MMKELEDYSWFPNRLRRLQTEFIAWMVQAFGIYRRIPNIMHSHLPAHALKHITDLGSGSGGPLPKLCKHPLLQDTQFLLTDLYPQPEMSLPKSCTYLDASADARSFAAPSGSTISFFNTFHHFSLEEQKEILTRNLSRGHCLIVAEILTPDLGCSLRILLATTVGQVLFAPFVKPFSLTRMALTWLLPVNLITVTWDGLISVWKSPGRKQRKSLQEHAAALGAQASWIQAGNPLLPVQLLVCIPAQKY
jgi:hypothetical protein